jgi:hypothetical protein
MRSVAFYNSLKERMTALPRLPWPYLTDWMNTRRRIREKPSPTRYAGRAAVMEKPAKVYPGGRRD